MENDKRTELENILDHENQRIEKFTIKVFMIGVALIAIMNGLFVF